ncbi:MAG TPA: hypothetical protein VFS20_22960 [Longimicrobium sp.]|nr:hypothetical protein [Longimicrobium sp.]
MSNTRGIPDFTILRQIAEAASGARGDLIPDVVWLVYDPSLPDHHPYAGKVQVWRHKPEQGTDKDVSDDAIVIETLSRTTRPATPPTYARIGRNGKTYDLLDLSAKARDEADPATDAVNEAGPAADAVFWTESAVEKFVVPYYASVHGPRAARKVAAVLKVLHDSDGEKARDQNAAVENFALIHLPTSEYIERSTVPEGGRAQADEFYIAQAVRQTGDPEPGTVQLVSLDAWVEAQERKE